MRDGGVGPMTRRIAQAPLTFLDACPVKGEATMRAVLDAVAAPLPFSALLTGRILLNRDLLGGHNR